MIIKGLKATWEKDTALQVVHALHCPTVGQALRCIQQGDKELMYFHMLNNFVIAAATKAPTPPAPLPIPDA